MNFMGYLHILYYLHQLQKNQWLTLPELEKLQHKKLKAIVRHAYQNVKFYHKMFDRWGIKPREIKTKEDLTKLPLITKSDITNSFPNDIVANNIDMEQCHNSRTSGSTAEPLTSIFDEKSWDFAKYAVKMRARLACGLNVGDRMICIEASRNDLLQREEKKLGFRIGNLFLKRKYLSVFNDIQDHLPVLTGFRPDAIYGFPSYFKLLAQLVQEKEINSIRPKMFFTSGELLDKATRKAINSVFEAELFDIYGNTEVKEVAWECGEHAGYHINMDSVVVEFIRDGEPVSEGERGQIVITSLHNYAMPLLRYTVGDVGVPTDDPCSCGRGLPLMKVLEGRLIDFVVLPSRVVSPYLLTDILEGIPGIVRYQIVQEKKDKIMVQFIPVKSFSKQIICRQIIEQYQKALGEDIDIKPIIVDALPRDRSGKFRVVISKVSSNQLSF